MTRLETRMLQHLGKEMRNRGFLVKRCQLGSLSESWNLEVAMANAIAALAGAKASDVKVDITIPQAVVRQKFE